MDPPPGERPEFDRWYREEHIPLRMDLDGFRGAVRGWAVQGEPSHLVVYYTDDLKAFETPEYEQVKRNPSSRTRHMLDHVAAFTRFVGLEISDSGAAETGRYIYLVTFAVPDEHQAEFDAWYEQDHVPLLLRNEHWLRCRRYAVVDAEPPGVTRAAVHELADLAALDSRERKDARSSEWRARLAQNDYFSSARYAAYEVAEEFEARAD